jgi:hypothetical protein
VAIAKRDLWGYVQRALLEEVRPGAAGAGSANVRVLSPTLVLREVDEQGWHSPRLEARASSQLAALEAAVAQGNDRKVARLRDAWKNTLHADRVVAARTFAGERGLRCDPIGHGPVLDRPSVHYRDRLPWGVAPVSAYRDPLLPARAASVIDEWNAAGPMFDRFYVADEPPTTTLPTHSLVGVITTDGRQADWYVLDRWAT